MRNLALGLLLVCVACGGSPTSPSGQSEAFTWTVNGQSFTASSNGRGALRSSGFISLTGANCNSGANINILVPAATVGTTYNITQQGVSASWTPDAKSNSNERWEASSGPAGFTVGVGSGTVTITSVSSDWVAGNFNVVAAAQFSNQDKTPKTIQGTFELSFRNGRSADAFPGPCG
jgi:hypothetical protein